MKPIDEETLESINERTVSDGHGMVSVAMSYTASPRKRAKRMVLCPCCQAPCVVYMGVYPHTGGTTAYCETHHWLHSYDPRRMAQVQGALLADCAPTRPADGARVLAGEG